jgi:phosphoglycerate dehydrogenase-like enzyme
VKATVLGNFVKNPFIALEPKQFPAYVSAIENAGGEVVPIGKDVKALVWTDYSAPAALERMLEDNPQLEWVQLPFAGVDAFANILNERVIFTSAKRSYSEPVAEHALALALALGRTIPERVRAKSWGKKFADSLFDEEVLIVGGGGIAQVLIHLLKPFRAKVTVLRKRTAQPIEGCDRVVGFDDFYAAIRKPKFIFVACALTNETRFLFDSNAFASVRPDAYLINVARGEVVKQDAVLEAIRSGKLAGYATDVTYPEPLPEGSEMWHEPKILITPHTADTMPIVTRLFAERLDYNVRAWLAGADLMGIVDPKLGY